MYEIIHIKNMLSFLHAVTFYHKYRRSTRVMLWGAFHLSLLGKIIDGKLSNLSFKRDAKISFYSEDAHIAITGSLLMMLRCGERISALIYSSHMTFSPTEESLLAQMDQSQFIHSQSTHFFHFKSQSQWKRMSG